MQPFFSDTTFSNMLTLLHRGGAYGYYWTMSEAIGDPPGDGKPGRREEITTWYRTSEPRAVPHHSGELGARHVYFGVHPTTAIPARCWPDGTPKRAEAMRAYLEDIAAINCVYAEFDDRPLAQVTTITPLPSIIIQSSPGKYHVYWLLKEPFVITTEADRQRAKALQAGWVALMGGDGRAKDLSRVLRVPGTRNVKAEYGPNYPTVAFVVCELDTQCAYTLGDFEPLIAAAQPPPTSATPPAAPAADARIAAYVASVVAAECAAVRSAPEHTKHTTRYNAGIKVGSLAHYGVFRESELLDRLTDAALSNTNDPAKARKDVQDGLQWGIAHPRTQLPDRPLPAGYSALPATLPSDDADTRAPYPALIHARDLVNIPKSVDLIPGVLATNKLHQLFAPGGQGKSYLALDMALTVAQFAPVVYLAAEAVEDYEARIVAWETLHRRSRGQLYMVILPVSLGDPLAVAAFIAAIVVLGCAAIFVDTLQACMVGLDESSTRDMGIAVEALNMIRRATLAAMIVVHHTGWDNARERGSSVLRAACRRVMKIVKTDDALIKLTCEKVNSGKPFAPRYFRLLEVAGDVVPVPASRVLQQENKLSAKQIEVLETLQETVFKTGATHAQIVEHTGIAKSTINRALSGLMERGYVTHSDKGKGYRITVNGEQALIDVITAETDSEPTHSAGQSDLNWAVVLPGAVDTAPPTAPEAAAPRSLLTEVRALATKAGGDALTVDYDAMDTPTLATVRGVLADYVAGMN